MSRVNMPKQLQIEVFYRDHWHCRYCLEAVFFNPTLKLLDKLSPGHGYYHPHGKSDATLPLFQWYFASADHIVPVSRGGKNEINNLVPSCWKCNLNKNDNDPNDYKCLDIPDNLANLCWDGLFSIYPKIGGDNSGWIKLIQEDYCI
jgi:hypothetical protein